MTEKKKRRLQQDDFVIGKDPNLNEWFIYDNVTGTTVCRCDSEEEAKKHVEWMIIHNAFYRVEDTGSTHSFEIGKHGNYSFLLLLNDNEDIKQYCIAFHYNALLPYGQQWEQGHYFHNFNEAVSYWMEHILNYHKTYTWDEIYERADGAAYGEPELKAKDEARYQVGQLMVRNGEPNPEDDEIPEESVENYCDTYNILFDYKGNIVS